MESQVMDRIEEDLAFADPRISNLNINSEIEEFFSKARKDFSKQVEFYTMKMNEHDRKLIKDAMC